MTISISSERADTYILKLNSKGKLEWQKTFDKEYDMANSIRQTADGGYIVAGLTYSLDSDSVDAYILKLNSKGEVQWQKTFGENKDDGANSIQQTTDGGYIVAGCTKSFGSGDYDVYILKIDSKGWVDTIAPEVKIVSPNDGIVLGGTIDINIDAKDNYDLEKVTLYIDGKKVKEYTSGPYKYSWDSSKATEGTHTITAEAVDRSGNVGTKSMIGMMNKIKDISWQKTFGGLDNDVANSIQETADGGYIVAGWIEFVRSGKEDAYILKLNARGDVEWEKTFGEKYSKYETKSVQQTRDGGYLVAGWTYSFNSGGYDAYILKLNARGEVEWQKTFGGKYDDVANSLQQTTDGGYIVAGWTKSSGFGYEDAYILKLNARGELEWQKTFGGVDSDGAVSIQQATDGGYIVAGWTYSFGSGKEDIYILKLNSKGEVDTIPPEVKIISPRDGVELGGTIEINVDATDDVELEKVTLYIDGNKIKEYTSGPYKYSWDSGKALEGAHTIIVEAVDRSGNIGRKSIATMIVDRIKDVSWQKTFHGEEDDVAESIQQTKDGGYIVAGWTESFRSEYDEDYDEEYKDVYILKLNAIGDVEWEKVLIGEYDDVAKSIQQTTDGGYIVAGWTNSFGSGGSDVHILNLNAKGDLEWHKTFGGEYDDEANSIQQTTDGGYIVAGSTYSFGSGGKDVYILKLNARGEVEWQKTFGGKYDDGANSIQQTRDGGYIVAGWTDSFGSGEEDAYILKLNAKGGLEWQKTFGGDKWDEAKSIQQTRDGGYIVAGWTDSFGSVLKDVYILKLNAKGGLEWQKTFGGEYEVEANSIQQTTDGGYIVAGYAKLYLASGEEGIYILKLNSKGLLEWKKTFGEEDDGANSIQQTTDGGYIVAGWTWSFLSGWEDFYILKLNSKGEVEE